jgi:hypothetical protein
MHLWSLKHCSNNKPTYGHLHVPAAYAHYQNTQHPNVRLAQVIPYLHQGDGRNSYMYLK